MRSTAAPYSPWMPFSHGLCARQMADEAHPYLQEEKRGRGAWVARSVGRPTSAEVMISQIVGSSSAWSSVLTAQSLEPASDSVSLSHSAPPTLMLRLCLSVCLCLSLINKKH